MSVREAQDISRGVFVSVKKSAVHMHAKKIDLLFRDEKIIFVYINIKIEKRVRDGSRHGVLEKNETSCTHTEHAQVCKLQATLLIKDGTLTR